jgi:hypothetical protein
MTTQMGTNGGVLIVTVVDNKKAPIQAGKKTR